MNDSVIAIRTADGAWFPVLEKSAQSRKQVVLTTAKDNQKRVHIDMYEGAAGDLSSSEYIGSLVIDQIDPAAAGETDIRFVAGVNERGQLSATATNLVNGDSQSISISLDKDERAAASGSESEDLEELPDFSMGEDDLELPEAGDETRGDDLESLEAELESAEGEFESLETVGDQAPSEEGAGQEVSASFVEEFDEPPLFDDEAESEVSEQEHPDEAGAASMESAAAAGSAGGAEQAHAEEGLRAANRKTGPSIAFYVAYMLLALAVLAGLIYLIYGAFQAEPIPPLESGRALMGGAVLFLSLRSSLRPIARSLLSRVGKVGFRPRISRT